MKVRNVLKEYDIEVDDIRWYLSIQEAERLLTYADEPRELARLIQSGKIEADWYRMEERFSEELQERLERRECDETEVRKICAEIAHERNNRYRG